MPPIPVGVNTLSKAGSSRLKGDVTLTGGTNVTLTQSGQDISIASSGGVNALLDGANHTDTVAQGVTRGSLIYGNSTPKWDELTLGTLGKAVMSDGTDALWRYPGAVLLQSATATDDATIDFVLTSPANADFFAYVVVWSHVAPASDNVEFHLRTSTDGGATYDAGASDYRWANSGATDAAGGITQGDGADTDIRLQNAAGNAANETQSGYMFLYLPSSAAYGTVSGQNAGEDLNGNVNIRSFVGKRISAAEVNAIRFFFSSGAVASGEFRLYGLPAA